MIIGLGTIIKKKFPNKMNGTEYIVEELDGDVFISHWDAEAMGQKKPTSTQIKKWQGEVEEALTIRKAKDEVGENIIKRLGAKDKTDAIVQQINAQRMALVEIQKAINGETPDAEVVAELEGINTVIEEELAKLA